MPVKAPRSSRRSPGPASISASTPATATARATADRVLHDPGRGRRRPRLLEPERGRGRPRPAASSADRSAPTTRSGCSCSASRATSRSRTSTARARCADSLLHPGVHQRHRHADPRAEPRLVRHGARPSRPRDLGSHARLRHRRRDVRRRGDQHEPRVPARRLSGDVLGHAYRLGCGWRRRIRLHQRAERQGRRASITTSARKPSRSQARSPISPRRPNYTYKGALVRLGANLKFGP